MNTFRIMLECIPWLAFVGFGLNFLLTALFPWWRGKNWNHWKLYSPGNFQPDFLASFLGQLGVIKHGPIVEKYFDKKSTVFAHYILAAVFLFFGISGLVLIVYRSAYLS